MVGVPRPLRTHLVLAIIAFALLSPPTNAREPWSDDFDKLDSPELAADRSLWAFAQHDVGNINMVVTNFGLWGFGWYEWHDYFTGEPVRKGSEFPKESLIYHLQSAQIWIGGILGKDTLASIAFDYDRFLEFELNPSPSPYGPMETRPIGDPTGNFYEEAISNQDIITVYSDTVVDPWSGLDYLRGTPHVPLHVEITQRSYAWSHDLADDFILFDMVIKNIGQETIRDLYFGILSRPSVGVLVGDNHTFDFGHGSICGFIDTVSSPFGCGIIDSVNMMWGANNDGDPVGGAFIDELVYNEGYAQDWIKSAPDVHGIFFLDYPAGNGSEPVKISYNWWSPFQEQGLDFGPRHREGYRDFRTGGTGWPLGDANRYHVMGNGEIDYDLLRTYSIGYTDPIWLPPPAEIARMASTDGLPGPPNLMSVGPFTLHPGFDISVPFAFVCGKDFHTDPANGANLPSALSTFYKNVDFSNLLKNSAWARWIYDNPGVDTDGDDYAGDFVVCNGDTVYYTGDGIADWRGAVPPPAPEFWLEPITNGLRVHFNGSLSETQIDAFSQKIDFEGYRVYCGRDERATSLALAASYDVEDYNKYVWNTAIEVPKYELLDTPFSLDSLRCLYGNGPDPCLDDSFDPLFYTPSNPLVPEDYPDSVFYFLPNDHNVSEFGIETPIVKTFPNEPHPSSYYPDSIPTEAYTSRGQLKYYEYQFDIDDLLATIPYYVNVTARDFGDPALDIRGLESSLSLGVQNAYPVAASGMSSDGENKVYVYPNPYRIDADYRDRGFEGRNDDDRPDYRLREIHFVNLPPRCTISIYSLDGDLLRTLKHDRDPFDPNNGHDSWNMITRNTQAVVTGLYYWIVETEDGTVQMGKLAIIM